MFLRMVLAAVLTAALPAGVLADWVSTPHDHTVWSPNRQYCAEVKVEHGITVHRMNGAAKGEVLWTWPWYLAMYEGVYLSDDGRTIAIGNVGLILRNYDPKSPLIVIITEAKVVRTLTLNDLISDLTVLEKTVSHYHWGYCSGFDSEGRFVVMVLRKVPKPSALIANPAAKYETFLFDAETGKRVMPAGVASTDSALAPKPSGIGSTDSN